MLDCKILTLTIFSLMLIFKLIDIILICLFISSNIINKYACNDEDKSLLFINIQDLQFLNLIIVSIFSIIMYIYYTYNYKSKMLTFNDVEGQISWPSTIILNKLDKSELEEKINIIYIINNLSFCLPYILVLFYLPFITIFSEVYKQLDLKTTLILFIYVACLVVVINIVLYIRNKKNFLDKTKNLIIKTKVDTLLKFNSNKINNSKKFNSKIKQYVANFFILFKVILNIFRKRLLFYIRMFTFSLRITLNLTLGAFILYIIIKQSIDLYDVIINHSFVEDFYTFKNIIENKNFEAIKSISYYITISIIKLLIFFTLVVYFLVYETIVIINQMFLAVKLLNYYNKKSK